MSQLMKKVENMSSELPAIGEIYLVSKILNTIPSDQPVYAQALEIANRRQEEYSDAIKTLYTDYLYFQLNDVVHFWINGHMQEVDYGEISVNDDGRILFFDPATGKNFDVTNRLPALFIMLNREYFINLPEDELHAASVLYDMINSPKKALKLYFPEFKRDQMNEVLDRIKFFLSHKLIRSLPDRLGKEDLLKVFAMFEGMTDFASFKVIKYWKSMVYLGKYPKIKEMADCIESLIREKDFKDFADTKNEISQQELLYIQAKVKYEDADNDD